MSKGTHLLGTLRSWTTSPFSKTVGIYALSNALSAGVPFLLLPILTRFLTPEDYGVVAMFQVLIGLSAAFTGLSVQQAVTRQYYERESLDFPAYVGNCLWILLLSTAAFAAVLGLCAESVTALTSVPAHWLWVVVAVAAAQFITRTALSLWQVRVRPVAYATFQVMLTVTNAGLTLWLVVGEGMGWEGRVWAQLGAYALFAVLGIAAIRRSGFLAWRPDRKLMRHALRFGLPLLPNALGGLVISMTDRTLVTNLLDVEATGIYVVGMQIGMVIAVLQDAFHRGWLPWFVGQTRRGDPEQDRRIVQVIYLYDAAILTTALLLAWVTPWLFGLFIDARYADGSACVLWIALGFAFNGMYKMRSSYLFYANKTHLIACVTVVAACVNVVASYFLIRANGFVGAAQGTMLAFLVGFVLSWVLARRVHAAPWSLRRDPEPSLSER